MQNYFVWCWSRLFLLHEKYNQEENREDANKRGCKKRSKMKSETSFVMGKMSGNYKKTQKQKPQRKSEIIINSNPESRESQKIDKLTKQ